MKETAYFVHYPRIVEDLMKPHLIQEEKPFEIIKEVTLSKYDYENFVTDMVADREFLDGFDVMRIKPNQCVLVKRRGKQAEDAVLVVPTKDGHVFCAAYVVLD